MSEHDAEGARVAAEDERREHEVSRRIAEGGPDQHVPGNEETGRVEAEEARAEAETGRVDADAKRDEAVSTVYRRVTTLHAMRWSLLLAIPLLVVILFLYLNNRKLNTTVDKLDTTIVQLEQEIADRCEEGRVNRVAIRDTLLSGLDSLGYRYDEETNEVVRSGPPIDYFSTRQGELDAALADAKAALQRFPPIVCPAPPGG